MGHFGGHFGGHFDVPREIRRVVEDQKLTTDQKIESILKLTIENSRKIDNSWKNWKLILIGFVLGVIASTVSSLILSIFK